MTTTKQTLTITDDSDLVDLTAVGAGFVSSGATASYVQDGIGYSEINLSTDGISMSEDIDITIGGKSLKDFMQSVEDRLCRLQEDFEKHEQYPALKAAYEQYKLIEKLLDDYGKSE